MREYYQRKFRYVLIDEYQDTNHLQYLLAGAAGREAGKTSAWWGTMTSPSTASGGPPLRTSSPLKASIQDARAIRLEQNYRSTGNILEAANAVIRNNRGRKGKNLWTEHGDGGESPLLHRR